MRFVYHIIVSMTFVFFGASVNAYDFPALTGQVVDEADILTDAEERQIVSILSSDKENQVALVTLSSLRGYDLESYVNELFNHWGLGDKEKNNGVLIAIAPNERQARIEVGYGLEHILTDAKASKIMRTDIIPHAKEGDYAAAAMAASQSVIYTLTDQMVGADVVADTSAYRNGGIFDEAGLLSETQKETIQSMIEAEKRIPIIVAIASSLRGQGTSYFSQVQTDLQLGRKTKNEMVFIAIAPNEKKIGLIIGDKTSDKYISDDRMREINSTILTPYATKRDYAGGIEQTILAIKTNLDNPRPAQKTTKTVNANSTNSGKFLEHMISEMPGFLLLLLIPFLFMLGAFKIYQDGAPFTFAMVFFVLGALLAYALYVPVLWNILVFVLKLFGIKTLFGKDLKYSASGGGRSGGSSFRGGGFRSGGGGFRGGGGRSGGGGASGRW
ncbi:MAG: TPM domain-containing protein [Alphaproteobacteria bacterium]|nr:TPM domain-containing protein [Alphaproteobacteria bacterium]